MKIDCPNCKGKGKIIINENESRLSKESTYVMIRLLGDSIGWDTMPKELLEDPAIREIKRIYDILPKRAK